MARSYYKLEASTTTSSYALELTNTRLSRPSLILKDNEPEFNFEYLRFGFQQDPKQLYKQILEPLY